MKPLAILKHAIILALVLAGTVFIAMGASSFLDQPNFGVLFFWIGMGIVYLAVRLNRMGDPETAVERIYKLRKTELAVTLALAGATFLTKGTAIGWLLLWPLWGTQSIVYMASVFADRILLLPVNVGIIFRGLALSLETVYLYFIARSAVGILRPYFSR